METKQETRKNYLFFDTETSGFIKHKLDYNHPNQSWCVQLGALLTTKDEKIDSMNMLVKAEGRNIDPSAEAVHKIDIFKCDNEGHDEETVISCFLDLVEHADVFVCHNFDFDYLIVSQMYQRVKDNHKDLKSLSIKMKNCICTMKDQKVIDFCRLPSNNKKYKNFKWPKLEELYHKLFNKSFDNAHDAFADVKATKECFFELVKRGIIKEDYI